jgi:hypothetical protein
MKQSEKFRLNALFAGDERTRRDILAAGSGALVLAGSGFLLSVSSAQAQAPLRQALGQKIVQYAHSHVGQCVADINGTIRPGSCGPSWMPPNGEGPGECTHLVHSALAASGGRPPDYSKPPHFTWGNRVGAAYQPGDIIQLVNARFDGPNGAFWETSSQHTAIIENAQGTVLHLLQQHSPERTVTRGTLDLSWRLSPQGDFAIFRPVPV